MPQGVRVRLPALALGARDRLRLTAIKEPAQRVGCRAAAVFGRRPRKWRLAGDSLRQRDFRPRGTRLLVVRCPVVATAGRSRREAAGHSRGRGTPEGNVKEADGRP